MIYPTSTKVNKVNFYELIKKKWEKLKRHGQEEISTI